VNEHERVEALRRLFGSAAPASPSQHLRVDLGIGDDAALLSLQGAGARIVVTVDEQVEDAHFRLSWLSFEDLGFRSTMAAASDVAAMGGRASACFSSLVVPRSLGDEDLLAIARGQALAASHLGAVVAGGNLARGAALSIGTTVLGSVEGLGLRRDGARPGDALWLAGPVGRAGAGLAMLATQAQGVALEGGAVGAAAQVCLEAWRRPEARQKAGLAAAAGGATALIDISDGLAADAGHVARASGLRLVLEERPLLADATLATVASRIQRSPLGLALGGGEDYALLAATPPGTSLPGFVRIGRCESGAPEVIVERVDGTREPPPLGWDHFR
jgi:thiamine-monophosphate kinase